MLLLKKLRQEFYQSSAILLYQSFFFGSFFLYQEPFTFKKVLGFISILIALIIISFKKQKIVVNKNFILGLTIYIFLGLAWLLDKKGAKNFSPDLYNLLVWFFPIFVIIFPKLKISSLITELKFGYKQFFLLALINVLGYYLQLQALNLNEATKVVPLIQISTIFSILFAALFLNEKENLPKKIFSAVLAVFGVYLLI